MPLIEHEGDLIQTQGTPFDVLWGHYQEDVALCRRFGITGVQAFAWELALEQENTKMAKKKKGKGYGC